jgi:ribosomal protein L9
VAAYFFNNKTSKMYNNFDNHLGIDTSHSNTVNHGFGDFDEADNFLIFAPFIKGGKRRAKEWNTKRKLRKKHRAELQQEQQQELAGIERNGGKMSSEAAALNSIENNKESIQKYIEANGHEPQINPALMALQGASIFQSKIAKKQLEGVPEYEAAHDAVIDDEQDEFGEVADEFFGAALASVVKGASEAIKKINAKRAGKGLKPLFRGKNWQKIGEKLEKNKDVLVDAANAQEKAFLAITQKEYALAKANESALGAGVGAAKDEYTNQLIKQYLPVVIIVLVIVFFLGKKL